MTITFRKLLFLAVIASLAVILAACKPGDVDQFIGGGEGEEATQEGEGATEDGGESTEGAATVTYTDDGFSPATVTVSSGDSITWTNNSSKTVQVGSDTHPTHTINRDITGDAFVVEVEPGESQTVTVTKTGSWGYHDHLRPSKTGTVVVE